MTHKREFGFTFLWIIAATLVLGSGAHGQKKVDVWEPMKFFAGTWEGAGKGKPGVSKIQREYQFVLSGKFLQVRNKSTYDPQPANPKGEIHDDWGIIGFDKARKQFLFRQFHVEGFVIQYLTTVVDAKTIMFTSESIENIPAGWRARETYRIISDNEFVEIFELAEPGKEFSVYSEASLKRKM